MKKFLLSLFVLFLSYTSSYAQVAEFIAGGLIGGAAFLGLSFTFFTASGGVHTMNDTETFILVNMDFLRSDIATGAGDTIDALAVLMDVDDATAFGKKLQANFDIIYPRYDVDYVYVNNAINNFVLADSSGEL